MGIHLRKRVIEKKKKRQVKTIKTLNNRRTIHDTTNIKPQPKQTGATNNNNNNRDQQYLIKNPENSKI